MVSVRRYGLTFLLAVGMALAALAAERDESWLRQRVKQVQASGPMAWRSIPWAPSLVAACKAAKRERRLVFVFTHDGNINTGRC
jgi:hypothetical protein